MNLAIDKGVVTMQEGDTAPVTIPTELKAVSPYTSVPSGTGSFDVSP